ncbi:MAG: hypothetical protein R3F43_20800 [bacterium]
MGGAQAPRVRAYHEGQRALLETEPAETLMEASIRLYFRVLQDRPQFQRLLTWMALRWT